MKKRKLSRKANSLLMKILEVKGEPVTLIYYAITKIAEEYDLTYEQLISILMNFRQDCLQKSLKEKFSRIVNWEIVEEYITKDKQKVLKNEKGHKKIKKGLNKLKKAYGRSY